MDTTTTATTTTDTRTEPPASISIWAILIWLIGTVLFVAFWWVIIKYAFFR